MKKISTLFLLVFNCVLSFGENQYFPVGTTWIEERGYWEKDTITYVVGDEVMFEGVVYNEVLANGERYCLLREEGPLVYIWRNEYNYGLLYDFDWWEGKEYSCDVNKEDSALFSEQISGIEEKVLLDGNSYQVWYPELLYGIDYIICGIGATNSILQYHWPETTGTSRRLLEFTREIPLYRDPYYQGGTIDNINCMQMGSQETKRAIRLKRNEIGTYDLQVRSSDGTWQIVK